MKIFAKEGTKYPPAGVIGALGLACVATAVISGLLLGLWEMAHPVFGHGRYTINPVSASHLWTFCILQAVKPLGFIAGLIGLFLIATQCGVLLKLIMALAAGSGAFYAAVWIMIAVTRRDDAIYIGHRAIGSDVHSNGGILFLWVAPVAVGIAALVAHRVARWKSIWVIGAGVLDSRIFGLFAPGSALMIEGILWLVIGKMVIGGAADQPQQAATTADTKTEPKACS
jgi:hypothetical protein